jgi:hypothetical protein
MKRLIVTAFFLGSIAVCAADDKATDAAAALAAQRAARPRQAAPVAPAAPPGAAGDPAAVADAPKFISEALWIMAGYNSNEPVYSILVTNQDSRILRCTTEMQGFYFENGEKQSISDRQVTTVMPNEQTKVGNWMDMDQNSGATYTVKCKPV